ELAEVDAKYNWTRSYPGGCIWELHGIYDSKQQKLLKPDYFKPLLEHTYEQNDFDINLDPNAEIFIEHFFVGHWLKFKELVEKINSNWFKFMQSPVNAPPPDLIERFSSALDNKTVYSPHFYDGLTLLLKKWRFLNVDAIGVMRSLYKHPIQALRFGDNSISKGFAQQFEYLKQEGVKRLGEGVPLLMTEIVFSLHNFNTADWSVARKLSTIGDNKLARQPVPDPNSMMSQSIT
ncbi:hypothetical protein FF38_07356, partial [Lucilia cuprina]